MAALTVTVIGRDQPGLVRALSERVADAGGNWLESRMARLAGQFAGILLVEAPADRVEGLAASLRGLEAEGLRVAVERGGGTGAAGAEAAPQRVLALDLLGQDRPGIVREIAQALAGRGVNIEELTTDVASGSFSGESLFRAQARLRVPPEVSLAELRGALETLAHELMVDLSLEPPAEA